ncbi:hypothetical protein D3OALGA1CA_4626 [Olavius algarvensis associated proteobacterium Delta 3]|nr:hypothetical protein D3OALGB2SA_4814 [Olavius algarvensis associated proteobacterium Delta 3]CAB5154380.1 hypothetical protein D3OALGA1CA_4626 [Olavius algarvensis associated proteobacterium Delta 3]
MIISLVLGTVVSAITLYLAFRNVPFADLVAYLGTINYLWMIPATLVILISFMLRAVRWQIILRSARRVGFWEAHNPMMIGFMMNCVLPGRVGELARPILLRKQSKVPFTTGLATVAAERVFDLIMLIALFAFVLATVPIDPELNMTFGNYQLNRDTLEMIATGMLRICFVFIIGIILVTIDYTRSLIQKTILRIPQLLSFGSVAVKQKIHDRLAVPLANVTDNIASGFSLVRYPKSIALIGMLSLIIWLLAAFSYYIIALGCPGVDLSYPELTAVMVIVAFFIALPSVPGFWGLWEAGGVFAMTLFGVPGKEAAGFTLANHALQMLPVILVGFAAAIVTGVNILQVTRSGDLPDPGDRDPFPGRTAPVKRDELKARS